MKKIINSTNDKYEAQLTEEWVLDDTPTEGSFNAVTSNGVAKAIAGGSTTYTAGDGIDITEGEISAKLAEGSGLRFDNGGLQIVHQLATPGAEDEGKVLTVTNGLGSYAWADPQGGGSSTVATTGCIAGDGSSNNKINLLYDGSLDLTSPEYTLTIDSSGTYGTCGTLTAYSSEVLAVLPAPCSFYFRGFQWPGMSQTCTASCYLYCPSTQALIRSESTTIYASGTPTRANITLDVNNPAEGSTGVFDGNSYEYDWEVYLVINGSETSFTDADLISHAKLSVKNPLPSSIGTAGQVLTVNSGATGIEWKTPSALPSYSGNECLKILRVNAVGNACSWDDQVKCFMYTSSFSGYYNAISDACTIAAYQGFPPVCMIIPGGSSITGYPLNSGALYSTDSVLLTLVSYDSNWSTTEDRCIVFSGITYAGSDLYAITYKQSNTSGFMGSRVPTHSLTASKLSIAT